KKYEGANAHVQLNDSAHGGFKKRFFALTAGTNFAEDRGNIAFSLEHSQQDPLWFNDRFGREAFRTVRTPGGAFDSLLLPDGGNYTLPNGGSFGLGVDAQGRPNPFDRANRYVFDPNGSVRRQRFGGVSDTAGNCVDCDRSDGNQQILLQPDYKRTTFSSV